MDHFFEINDHDSSSGGGEDETQSDSVYDYAIIDFTNYTFSSWFGLQTNYSGGTVHLTGYPETAGFLQTDQVGTVSADPSYAVLDYGSVSSSPGNSGGPIWINEGTAANPLPYVVGVVSTTGWGVQLTAADLQQIVSWEQSDGVTAAAPTPSPGPGAAPSATNPPPPAGTTADMILRQASGNYEIYDIGNNTILLGTPLGQVGADYQFAGLGNFSGSDTTDMMLRSATSGNFEVYDISNNNITGAAALGAVGSNFQVAGFGNFNGPNATTDMMLRDVNTGNFELYDIGNNAIAGASNIGAVGLNFKVQGFGDFNGDGTTDMVSAR